MPIVASCIPRALLRQFPQPTAVAAGSRLLPGPSRTAFGRASPLVILVVSSASSFGGSDGKGWSRRRSSRKSLLSDLIQEIEPLDLNVIQRDVPSVTVDAMKRTISGMLGILPSDQFNVFIEALWDPLFKLFVSSMMTGYTLHNAEYRLSLERNLEVLEEHRDEHSEKDEPEDVRCDDHDKSLDRTPISLELSGKNELSSNSNKREGALLCEDADFEGFGELTSEAKEYIRVLKCQIASVEQVSCRLAFDFACWKLFSNLQNVPDGPFWDVERKKQKITEGVFESNPQVPSKQSKQKVGLRSLNFLRQPIRCKEWNPPPWHTDFKLFSRCIQASNLFDNGTLSTGKDDCAELLENTSIHLQPLIAIRRDCLARLLFWCLLLGHYLRGLEHRLELSQLLTIATDAKTVGYDDKSFG
ncbi:hypothetical protein HPP92_015352 [Vanilla planifolia]|uniref:Uncharacterized protein n=1 Tax=Vanilla planifolia TaxID=51239 RepID=A0A835QR92_VANPL|nr:hypothetical protein HPP92_015352 [Vanilla planifolia]